MLLIRGIGLFLVFSGWFENRSALNPCNDDGGGPASVVHVVLTSRAAIPEEQKRCGLGGNLAAMPITVQCIFPLAVITDTLRT